MPHLNLTPTADGHAALTIDGATAVTVSHGPDGLTFTLPAADRPGLTVRRDAGAASSAGGGVSWDDTTATVTCRGRVPISFERMAAHDTTPSGVPALIGQDDFVWNLADGITRRRNMCLMGPTGVGKTTAVRLIAEAAGFAFVGTTITPGTTAEDLLGGLMPVPGDVVRFDRIDGPVTRAVRIAEDRPVILLLDEANRIDRVSEFTCLYPLLDGQGYIDVDGEQVRLANPSNLIVVMTANPAGGEYIGTRVLDPALSNRFGLKPSVDYPTRPNERRALMARVTGLTEDHARLIAEVAWRVRRSADVDMDLGFRTLHEWAEAVASGRRDIHDAAAVTIAAEAADQREAILNIIGMATTDATNGATATGDTAPGVTA